MEAVITRTCKTCNSTKPIDDFEKTTAKSRRLDCKKCYARKKAERAKMASKTHNPSSVPKPINCSQCSRSYPEVDFKWRSDVKKGGWRTLCNACCNEQEYYKTSRAKRRAEDEVGYLAKNAEVSSKWRKKNPKKVKEQQDKERMESDRRIKALATESKYRGIQIEFEKMNLLKEKFSQPCAYCMFTPEIGSDFLNGLDRMDCALGYTDANTAPCCGVCNHMKGPQEIDEFIDNIRRITKYLEIDVDSVVIGSKTPARALGGWSECRAAPSKEKKDLLTLDQKIDLWSSPCYLCGRGPSFGIDRLDACGDYTPENVMPCCTVCNYMKSDRPLDHFKTHVALVAAYTSYWVIRDVSGVPLKVCGGKQREPVAMLNGNMSVAIVFPSAGCAAKVIGASRSSVIQAVEQKCRCLDKYWRAATAMEYRVQGITPADVRNMIKMIRREF